MTAAAFASLMQGARTDAPRNVSLRWRGGGGLHLDIDRWFSEPAPEEEPVLDAAQSPALDVGCGPGRHTAALLARGIAALGVDVAPRAVRLACMRAGYALNASIFDPLPGTGRWGSALLLDGNVGIGGDPLALLTRVRTLLRPGGRALLEVERPGVRTLSTWARLEDGQPISGWFPWAIVAADHVGSLAAAAGFSVMRVWTGGGRWFARLDRR
jgi:SAM-dependent methyltransferase